MPRIEQKPQQFQPVVITLETEIEFQAFKNLVALAKASDKIMPASREELLITQINAILEDGIRVAP